MKILSLLLIFLGTSLSSASQATPLKIEIAVNQLNAIIANESQLGVPEFHQTRAYLVRNGDQIVKTPLSVVITHGLYNSPAWMDWMAQKIHKLGYNVINVRLPRHHQGNRSDLDQFNYQDALKQNAEIAKIAQQLGTKVVYYGHSLGAALSIYSAINNPETTAGLVLFSPALKVYGGAKFLAQMLASVKLSGWFEDMFIDPAADVFSRYLSPYAAIQVDLMTRELARLNSQDQDEDYKFIKEKLSDVPIFWGETALDIVIDLKTNQSVAASLKNTKFTILPWKLGISHDRIIRDPSTFPKLLDISDSCVEFIQQQSKTLTNTRGC